MKITIFKSNNQNADSITSNGVLSTKINSGFTLIELLVVISIMALFFSFSFASYRDFRRRQVLNQAALMVITDLRLTQQLALTGKKELGCGRLEYYSLIRDGNRAYRIEDSCTGGGGGTVVKNVQLPPNIRLLPFPAPGGNRIDFLVLAEGVDRPEDATIRLEHSQTSDYKEILVTLSGEIKEL